MATPRENGVKRRAGRVILTQIRSFASNSQNIGIARLGLGSFRQSNSPSENL
jgi:hypothetical protein